MFYLFFVSSESISTSLFNAFAISLRYIGTVSKKRSSALVIVIPPEW